MFNIYDSRNFEAVQNVGYVCERCRQSTIVEILKQFRTLRFGRKAGAIYDSRNFEAVQNPSVFICVVSIIYDSRNFEAVQNSMNCLRSSLNLR